MLLLLISVLHRTGGDTNADGLLIGKGTGSFRHAGPYDGWVAANETLTYASATTFTCSAALAGVLQKGDKIKLTQTTAKYFYVTGVSGTTVTVTGGTDYTLANAAITLPFYSHESNPLAFPQYFTWAPTLGNLSGGTQNYAVFSIENKTVTFSWKYTLAGAGVAGSVTYTPPVTAAAEYDAGVTLGNARFKDASSGQNNGWTEIVSTSSFALVVGKSDGTYLDAAGLSSTIPFNWAVSDTIYVTGSYKI
jgi:hypothetical protein